ncbi:MAG: 4-alpha-glucanotransferase [Hyphomicrobiaceae bacterium]
MAEKPLDRLAEAHGIALSYISETGESRPISDDAKRGLLGALGVAARTDADLEAGLAAVKSQPRSGSRSVSSAECYLPDWLAAARFWGVTCQLYGIRSRRNWGIGDFEDLARIAEIMAAEGADFIGVNPLHALFMAQPQRHSPYSPSSRRFLNPIYIATDRLPGCGAPPTDRLTATRCRELVDYDEVTTLKRAALEAGFVRFCGSEYGTGSSWDRDFSRFCAKGGSALADFALFETISEAEAASGGSAGWHGWPDELRSMGSPAVKRIAREKEERIRFHLWLQWVADGQLAAAQRRALGAGMRMGLYLDLAVGVAPDGADTWCAPAEVLAGARIGSPPDPFNSAGQDWGLAPLNPEPRNGSGGGLFRSVVEAAMRYAGAVRLDHAMALERLFLIPEGHSSADGGYVTYPTNVLVEDLARTSQECRTVVIGEDLGTVSPGFRETMREAGILGYRVLLFERDKTGGFRPPVRYDPRALACVSTHDLPTLAGWWEGRDLSEREALGLTIGEDAQRARAARQSDKRAMISALARAGILPSELIPFRRRSTLPSDLPDALCVAIHRFVARTPCRLVAAQLEDLLGSPDCLNIPGTTDEHPNWRRKIPIEIEDMAGLPLLRAICGALKEERPRSS